MRYEKITIYFKDSSFMDVWTKEEWDDYVYDGKYFIIKRNGQWVGMYNLDYVISIIVK